MSGADGQASAEQRLAELRERISSVNRQLVGLLEERGELVLEVMTLKRETGLPVHDPAREQDMIAQLAAELRGPFSAEDVQAVFAEVFRISRALGTQDEDRRANK